MKYLCVQSVILQVGIMKPREGGSYLSKVRKLMKQSEYKLILEHTIISKKSLTTFLLQTAYLDVEEFT